MPSNPCVANALSRGAGRHFGQHIGLRSHRINPQLGGEADRFERSASAALIAAIVCRKVLTFDPSDTIPPSTTAIDPIAAT